ncbi:MAG TPA: hypothetical protein VFU02_14150 [Polyangiaceae bacterium]|nr:hypothetical protein [Polyangiaceae bacterium]
MTNTGRATAPGRLEGALTRIFMKSTTVRASSELGERFRLVTLSGDSLRAVRWRPGQKVQVAIGNWAYRTFTPICWDADEGLTQLLLFLHGDTPGSVWGRALALGSSCTLFGPRDSIELDRLDRPALLFGDETSFGLAHAMRFTASGARGVRMVFEVSSREVAEKILDQLGITEAELVERKPADAHLSELEQVVVARVQGHSIQSCALSGKASSIQALSKRLRSLGISRSQLRTRAFWAPGKVGLD